MSSDPTRREKTIPVLADLKAERSELRAIARGIDPETKDSGPGDLLIGRPRRQSVIAAKHPQEGVLLDEGILIEPGTRASFLDQFSPMPVSGRSSLVAQVGGGSAQPTPGPSTTARGNLNPLPVNQPSDPLYSALLSRGLIPGGFGTQFSQQAPGQQAQRGRAILGPQGQPLVPLEPPRDVAPWSHQLRVVDGHLCFVGNLPEEHSLADRADMPGGGFLAWMGDRGTTRTRMGDHQGPMRMGMSIGQDAPIGAGTESDTVVRPVTGEGGHASSTGPREDGAPTQFESRAGGQAPLTRAERQRLIGQNEYDREHLDQQTTPEARAEVERQIAERQARLDADAAARQTGGWVQVGPRRYQLPDGRVVEFDIAGGSLIVGRSGGRFGSLSGNPPNDGNDVIVVGLGARPGSSGPRGAIVDQPATAAQTQRIDAEIALLQDLVQRGFATATERARLNELRRQRANQSTVTLGLAGGGDFSDARGRIVQVATDGSEYISVFGPSHQLSASVSSIMPRTLQEWNALVIAYRRDAQDTRDQLAGANARLRAAEGGFPTLDGAVEEPGEVREVVQQLEYRLFFIDATLEDIANGIYGTDQATAFARLEQEVRNDEAAAQTLVMANRPLETGNLLSALYGRYQNYGWPIAFDEPAEEAAHDLRASGPAWGLGHMIVWGNRWRPVCPIDLSLPGDGPPPDGPDGGGGGPPPPPPGEEEEEKKKPPPRKKYVGRSAGGSFKEPPIGLGEPDGPFGKPKVFGHVVGLGRFGGGRGRDGGGASDPPAERGKRNPEDPDELIPCDEAEPGTSARETAFASYTASQSPQESVRRATGSYPAYAATRLTAQPVIPRRTDPLGAGQSIIQPPRPAGMTMDSDQRVRRGGGPWHPEASLIPRGGVRILDRFDFVARKHTVFDALQVVTEKLNEVIALENERHPHGPSVLEHAGLYLPPQRGRERPAIEGAFDGTISHTRNRDGQIQPWVQDGGKPIPQSYDHHQVRTQGTGKRLDDIITYLATGETSDPRRMPRVGWVGRVRRYVFERVGVLFGRPIKLQGGNGGTAEITAEMTTDERQLKLPDWDGVAVVADTSIRRWMRSSTDDSSVAGVTETVVFSGTIPPNTLAVGSSLAGFLGLDCADLASLVGTVRLKIDGTTVLSFTLTVDEAASLSFVGALVTNNGGGLLLRVQGTLTETGEAQTNHGVSGGLTLTDEIEVELTVQNSDAGDTMYFNGAWVRAETQVDQGV